MPANLVEMLAARDAARDRWVPAYGGTATWERTREGADVLYVWNAGRQMHGFLHRDDIVRDWQGNPI